MNVECATSYCFRHVCSGKIFPSGVAADSYKKAVDSAIEKLRNQEVDDVLEVAESVSYVFYFSFTIEILICGPHLVISMVYLLFMFRTPKTPIELAIDFILHDFEMAGKVLSID